MNYKLFLTLLVITVVGFGTSSLSPDSYLGSGMGWRTALDEFLDPIVEVITICLLVITITLYFYRNKNAHILERLLNALGAIIGVAALVGISLIIGGFQSIQMYYDNRGIFSILGQDLHISSAAVGFNLILLAVSIFYFSLKDYFKSIKSNSGMSFSSTFLKGLALTFLFAVVIIFSLTTFGVNGGDMRGLGIALIFLYYIIEGFFLAFIFSLIFSLFRRKALSK